MGIEDYIWKDINKPSRGDHDNECRAIAQIAETLNKYICSDYSQMLDIFHFIRSNYPEEQEKYRERKKFFRIMSNDSQYIIQYNGRKYPQYNIALEDGRLRYGIAISFQESMSMPHAIESETLRRAFCRLGEYTEDNMDVFADCKFYYWTLQNNTTIIENSDRLYAKALEKNAFIFFGSMIEYEKTNGVTWKNILDMLEKLRPLYLYMVNPKELQAPAKTSPTSSKNQISGMGRGVPNTAPVTITVSDHTTISERLHARIQARLIDMLKEKYPSCRVEAEVPLTDNRSIDVVMWPDPNDNDKRTYYEIKTGMDIRSCIRQAIGQLLEYKLWNTSSFEGVNLCIVSRFSETKDSEEYLGKLNALFGLGVNYMQVPIEYQNL